MLYLRSECLHKNAVKVHTNIHTQRCHEDSGGLFPVILPFVNQPAWDMTGWLPWKMRSQSLRSMCCEQMKIAGKLLSFETFDVTVRSKYIQSWHTPFAIIQTCMHMYISICGQNTLNTFSYLDMDLPLTVHCTPSPPSVFSFFFHFFVCRHITPWNVFKIKSHLGLVIYKGSESTNLLADIKLSTCILETQLRLSISLNNPCCPPPSDNTHWILQRHYLQSEVTRHNPSPGRSF